MYPDLMGTASQQRTLDERQPILAGQGAIDRLGDFGARRGMVEKLDLFALFVAPQVVFNQAFARGRGTVYDAQIPLGQLMMLDFIVHHPQGFGGLGRNDDAARVAVDAVAQRRGER